MVKLNRRPAKRTDTPRDLIELIARLAEHSNDREIAMVLSKQGLRTATDLPFTESRVARIRERAGIPAARIRADKDGTSIRAAAAELGVSIRKQRRLKVERRRCYVTGNLRKSVRRRPLEATQNSLEPRRIVSHLSVGLSRSVWLG